MYKNNNRVSNAIMFYDKTTNTYKECFIKYLAEIDGFTTTQYKSDKDIKLLVDQINSAKEQCNYPVIVDVNCCYFSVDDINRIKDLIKDYFQKQKNNGTIYTNYTKSKKDDSKFNDLCDRILICELLNHHKELFRNVLNKQFVDLLERCWVESNELQYGPDLKFIDLHSQKIILYGDVENYVDASTQYVYMRKLKQNNQQYYISLSENKDLQAVYVFRFLFNKHNGQIKKLICYNINDIDELSPDIKYNQLYSDDKRMILDETRSITIDVSKLKIIRCVKSIDEGSNQGFEQIYINGKLLRESDQSLTYELITKNNKKGI